MISLDILRLRAGIGYLDAFRNLFDFDDVSNRLLFLIRLRLRLVVGLIGLIFFRRCLVWLLLLAVLNVDFQRTIFRVGLMADGVVCLFERRERRMVLLELGVVCQLVWVILLLRDHLLLRSNEICPIQGNYVFLLSFQRDI